MRIAVIGAGIAGVTSAYELAADGHEVTVFERRGSAAAEASFAHAGIVAPALAAPREAPSAPWRALGSWHGSHAAGLLGALPWLWRWWRSCHGAGYRANAQRMRQLATYSQTRLHHLTRTLQLDYERAEGHLTLLRTRQDIERAQPLLDLLKASGLRWEMLDAAHCRRLEPGLNPEARLQGGIHLPLGEVGNCRQFALMLREEAEKRGAVFRFHTQAQALGAGRTPWITRMHAPLEKSSWQGAQAPSLEETPSPTPDAPETESFDAVVVCAALEAAELLRPHGLALPLAAVQGYSITAPLRKLEAHPDLGPHAALEDRHHGVSICRLGARVRVSGGAELGGSLQQHRLAIVETLYKVLNDWFPGAAHMSQTQVWKGARAMLPDGMPVLGRCKLPGVWLNIGNGDHGWALACGSARLLADAIGGREPGVEADGLGIERLRL